jgi:hypothetical protein
VTTPTPVDEGVQPGEINWALIQQLHTRPHPLLNIADDFSEQLRSIPEAWVGEVFQEARTAHHLLDLAGIPRGHGDSSDLDARTYLLAAEALNMRVRLDRIADWHARETGDAGMVGDYCTECGNTWPCDTNRLATGGEV